MAYKIQIVKEVRNGISICRVRTPILLDPGLAEEMTDYLSKLFDAGDKKVLVNIEMVSRMSSLFFRSFILAGKKAKTRKAEMAFCNIAPTIKSGFDMMGLDSYFSIYKDEAEALEKLK